MGPLDSWRTIFVGSGGSSVISKELGVQVETIFSVN
jgi:hypothetical protein